MYDSVFTMVLISFIVGFSGNKLFNKDDKSNITSAKWGGVVSSVFTILHLILISI